MKLQAVTKYLGIFLSITIALTTGYFYGVRDKYDNKQDNIDIVGPNLAIQNSLSQLQTKDILGFGENNTIKSFGQFYYNIRSDKTTEVLFSFNNVPLSVIQANGKMEKSIPNQLNIDLARKTIDGLSYIYENIGKITFDEPKADGGRNGKFSTVIKPIKTDKELVPSLTSVQRIVFRPIKSEDNNIFKDLDTDIPPVDRDAPAPYFKIKL
ncbi:MAG: hypothetical protein H7196_01640 [candidate division SR1 bacterium]|nr:hypothetical protein [candidate division SR1 bacterium]